LKKSGIAGQTVVLKMKTADFESRTRNRKLEDPTQLADRIFRTGIDLLEKETDGTKFRLIGIGVTDLCDPARADPPDLVDVDQGRRAAVEAAMDKLRDKFGKGTVETGYTFGGKRDH
jgi:DNA polymerase-4